MSCFAIFSTFFIWHFQKKILLLLVYIISTLKVYHQLCDTFFKLCISFSEQFFLSDPELQDKIPLSFASHKELYEESVRKATHICRKINQLNSEGNDGIDNYM
jgi:hypothetical protein